MSVTPEPYAVYGPFYDASQGTPSGAQYLHLLRLGEWKDTFGDMRVYDERGWSRPRKTSRRLFYVCR